MLITNYVFVATFILHLWQFIYKYCSNSFNNIKLKFAYKLLLVQNTFEIYTSEVQFCSSYHVEHNGAISIQNVDHTKEIKYLFEDVACQKKESELDLSLYCSLKVTFISARGRHSLNPKERRVTRFAVWIMLGRAVPCSAIGRGLTGSIKIAKMSSIPKCKYFGFYFGEVTYLEFYNSNLLGMTCFFSTHIYFLLSLL